MRTYKYPLAICELALTCALSLMSGVAPADQVLTPVRVNLLAMLNSHSMSDTLDASSGVVQLDIRGPKNYKGQCTGAVLYSSKVTNESYILTAAHCFTHEGKFLGIPFPLDVGT